MWHQQCRINQASTPYTYSRYLSGLNLRCDKRQQGITLDVTLSITSMLAMRARVSSCALTTCPQKGYIKNPRRTEIFQTAFEVVSSFRKGASRSEHWGRRLGITFRPALTLTTQPRQLQDQQSPSISTKHSLLGFKTASTWHCCLRYRNHTLVLVTTSSTGFWLKSLYGRNLLIKMPL